MPLIHVTADDIAACNTRGSGNCCPVLRALQRVYGARIDHVTQVSVRVDGNPAVIGPVMLPEGVSNWLVRFDGGENMEPIEFRLDLP